MFLKRLGNNYWNPFLDSLIAIIILMGYTMKSYSFTFALIGLFLTSIFSVSFAQITWTKDSNPVLNHGPADAWDEGFVGMPSILFDGNTYHMWYSNGSYKIYGNVRSIGYATSADGINWIKYDDSTTTDPPFAESDPVLIPGTPGKWDSWAATAPSVLRIDTTYYMWYGGSPDPIYGSHKTIGYAKSTDGINWVKDSLRNPVLSPGSAGSWDDVWIYAPCVIFSGDSFHMWYMAYNGIDLQVRIGHATSPHPDSVWTKDPANPVLSYQLGSWDYPRVDMPFVIYDDNIYHMWYSGGDQWSWQIGYATSQDGSVWYKHEYNPVLPVGTEGEWDDYYVMFCSVMLDARADSTYRMWYTGGDSVWNGNIGHATAPALPTAIGENATQYYPSGFHLEQNYPNPFNPSTTIKFQIPIAIFTTLKVYNILGQEVVTLVSEKLSPGQYTYNWDASAFSSGVYYYKLEAGEYIDIRKLVFIK
jgi:predicted GH43/DUF377 family glycosyl hydrolase